MNGILCKNNDILSDLSNCDASDVAYYASAYLRIDNDEGSVHCDFVIENVLTLAGAVLSNSPFRNLN